MLPWPNQQQIYFGLLEEFGISIQKIVIYSDMVLKKQQLKLREQAELPGGTQSYSSLD